MIEAAILRLGLVGIEAHVREAIHQSADRDDHLLPGNVHAQATMRSEAEAHLVRLVAEDIVLFQVFEDRRIVVGGAQAHVNANTGGHLDALDFGIFGTETREDRVGRAPAQAFLDRLVQQLAFLEAGLPEVRVVRPALDVDNYEIAETAFSPIDATKIADTSGDAAQRLNRARQIRDQLAAIQNETKRESEELNTLLVDGPFPMTYGMAEGTPHNVHVQLRGEPSQPGEEVPRGFVHAVGGDPLPANTSGSGRLELAEWLTQPANPLTSRVMVNRIWQYHFGHGLVKTPNDFGVRGLPPSHPELLDHLATQFVRNGWSIKSMHRLIMLSATYQQASEANHAAPSSTGTEASTAAADAGELYTHFARRRLEAEEIRDSILAISGELDSEPAQGHPFPSPTSWGFSQHGPFSAVYDHNKRSVYLMTQRLKRHPFLALFDGPDTNASTADRLGTTVPTQALYFLNDPFVHTKADAWATRLEASRASRSQQIDYAYRLALGRPATADESLDAETFLDAYQSELTSIGQDNVAHRALTAFLRTLLGSNEFLHVD